jgi:hypothetical protein
VTKRINQCKVVAESIIEAALLAIKALLDFPVQKCFEKKKNYIILCIDIKNKKYIILMYL